MPTVPRPGYSKTLLAPTTVTVAAAGTVRATVTGLGSFEDAIIQLKVTAAATEAGDTLDVFIDTSLDRGATWINVAHFPQVLGTGGAKTYTADLAPGATTGAAPVDVTADAAVNTVRPGILGDRIRVRDTAVDVATLANMSFTYGVIGYFQ
jgi:hypothetical protein